ncbi:hypothetical protein QMT40_001323 [Parvibaculaceae bacterium PLY_AMNH_Bact1]|nr:hypothetical protein QMT40_001323 [Parvibaculaceae bacterium PLY_AMNH_Bact1]
MTRPLLPLPAAVFCHAQWRTGSTAIFTAFRADPRFMCFYEPLHEGLRTMTKCKAMRYDPDDVRRMGHEGLTKPYFFEYCELLAPRHGAPAFPAHLSYGEFFEVSMTGLSELRAYFQLLAEFARSKDKIPVFCLNRSWGRMRTFRDLLPKSVHIFSLRNPCATWESQKARRSYFFAKLLYIYSMSEPEGTNEAFPEIADLSFFERVRTERTFKRKIAEISDDRIKPLFWQAYANALANGVLHADFILDLDQTNPGTDDRLALGHYLARLPGHPKDNDLLSHLRTLAREPHLHGECRTPMQFVHASWQGIEAPALDREELLASACQMAPKLSAANRDILSRLVVRRPDAVC